MSGRAEEGMRGRVESMAIAAAMALALNMAITDRYGVSIGCSDTEVEDSGLDCAVGS